MSQFYALKCFTLFFLGGFLATEALPKQRSVLSEVNRSKLERTIVELEKVRQPAARFESLLSSAERSLEKQLRTIKHELKQLNISENLNETYYQTLSFTQVLNIVLQNLRAQGRTNLANQIQELATYVIGLERIKASGIYNGTEMERTLDRSIYENKKKLVDIINSLIQN